MKNSDSEALTTVSLVFGAQDTSVLPMHSLVIRHSEGLTPSLVPGTSLFWPKRKELEIIKASLIKTSISCFLWYMKTRDKKDKMTWKEEGQDQGRRREWGLGNKGGKVITCKNVTMKPDILYNEHMLINNFKAKQIFFKR